MKEDELTELRGEVMEGMIDLETMINCIISVRYLGKLDNDFYYEVLYDENFNLGLKINILAKILPSEKTHLKHIDNLRRLSVIRNHFAHRGTQFLSPGEPGKNDEIGIVPNPRQLDQPIDYESLFKEFNKKQDIEVEFLREALLEVVPRKKFTT